MSSLPKTVTRQRRDCDLNPGPSAPESSTLTTRLPSHPSKTLLKLISANGAAVRAGELMTAHHTETNQVITAMECMPKPARPLWFTQLTFYAI